MSPTHGLPVVFSGHRRGWLLALVANGLVRGLLLAMLAVAARAGLAGTAVPSAVIAAGFAALAAGIAAAAWLRQRQTIDAEALAQHYIAHVRLRLFDRLASFTPEEGLQRSRGSVLMRFTGDVAALRAWIGRGWAGAIVGGFSAGLLMLLLAWMAPVAALAAASLTALALWRLGRLRAGLLIATLQARRRQTAIAAFMQDRIAALPEVQAAGQARSERERLSRLQRRLRGALQARALWRGRHRATVDVLAGSLMLLGIAWAVWHLGGAATAIGAEAAPALGIGLLLGLLAAPLRELGRALEMRVTAEVAGDRVREFLASPGTPPKQAAAAAPAPRARLVVDAPQWHGRVQGPQAVVRWGQRVAVLGGAGSGKSSMLWLLAGLRRPDRGRVLLNDVPVAELSGPARARVALLSPDMPLLRGSVEDNLRWRAPSGDAVSRERACSVSGFRVLAPALAADPAQRIADAGRNLSHGQRRALALARALAGNPDVLLIDEPASCLPGEARQALHQLLGEWEGTVIFATTDESLTAWADETWLLPPATGPHASLQAPADPQPHR
jgi:ABC-type transport system involved in cytochrome bd biosynthesis fused ATPase/permease subunit